MTTAASSAPSPTARPATRSTPSQAATEDYQPGIPGLQVDLFKPVACDAQHPGGELLLGRLRARCRRLLRARRLDQPLPDRVVAAAQELHRPHRHRRPARRRAGASAHDRPARQPGRLHRGADDGHPVRRRRPVQLAQPGRELLQLGGRQLRLRRRLDDPGARLPDGSPDPAQPGLRLRAADAGRLHRQGRDPERPDPAAARSTRPRAKRTSTSSRGDSFKPAYPPPPCVGALHTVHVTNQDFIDARRQPVRWPGTVRCATPSSSRSATRKSIAPDFELFTDVPVPGKFWGLVNDNLNVSIDPKSTLFGEIAGIGNAPVGIYDFTDRLVDTAHTDPNGFFTALAPLDEHVQLPASGRPLPEHVPRGRQRPGPALGAQPRLPPRVRHDLGELPGLARADAAGRHGQHRRRHAGAVARLERHQAGAVPDRGHHAAALRGVGAVRQRRRPDRRQGPALRRHARAACTLDGTTTLAGGLDHGLERHELHAHDPGQRDPGPAPARDRQHGRDARHPVASTASRCTCSARATGPR